MTQRAAAKLSNYDVENFEFYLRTASSLLDQILDEHHQGPLILAHMGEAHARDYMVRRNQARTAELRARLGGKLRLKQLRKKYASLLETDINLRINHRAETRNRRRVVCFECGNPDCEYSYWVNER